MDAATLEQLAVEARPRLVSIAYRMLGSMSDAEDVVHDALLKAYRSAPDDLESPVAYLTTVTTRTAIDHLRSARVRRESYVGPWLPEPVLGDPAPDASADALLADSLSMAFLVVLESLTPEERAVLLLHDVFGYGHREIALVLDRTEASSRQLLRRARQRIEADRPRFDVDARQRDELVRRFVEACRGGDVEPFLTLLTDDAVYVADGGETTRAARYPIHGKVRIARFITAVLRKVTGERELRTVTVNGEPAVAFVDDGVLTAVVTITPAADGRIDTVHWVRNPDKLARLRAAIEASPPSTN